MRLPLDPTSREFEPSVCLLTVSFRIAFAPVSLLCFKPSTFRRVADARRLTCQSRLADGRADHERCIRNGEVRKYSAKSMHIVDGSSEISVLKRPNQFVDVLLKFGVLDREILLAVRYRGGGQRYRARIDKAEGLGIL